ncbi:spartin [Biomphalaria pfeifferi]|uniref:Spartin n=1 Tax=Biomphalaria pfeifferi TaxID=112525 RepID=A0AAD8BE45_BIOPF|nr:spartin [Biomphalaria pfeifferi]
MERQNKRTPPCPGPHHKTPSPKLQATKEPSYINLLTIVTYQDFQAAHDAAYIYISDGLQFDKDNQIPAAIENYNNGLVLLDACLEFDVSQLLGCPQHLIDNASTNQIKMSRSKEEIILRLKILQKKLKLKKPLMATAPPTYEEAVSQMEHPSPYSEDELTRLGEILMNGELGQHRLANAEEIFYISDGVQLYFISSEGLISAPTYPTSLQVLRLMRERGSKFNPIFITVGDWIYPLLPGQSPAFGSSYGAYLFPDTTSPGAAIALMLPPNLAQEDKDAFRALLNKLTVLEDQQSLFNVSSTELYEDDESTESSSQLENLTTISKGILTTANWISWGVIEGAKKGRYLIQRGSNLVRRKTKKCTIDHPVDPRFQKGIIYARQATGGAVKVTEYVVNKLGEATVCLAKEVAPVVRQKTLNVLPDALSDSKIGSPSAIDTVVEVAYTGLKGFAKVYDSLEKAAKCLGGTLVDESVKVVEHSYGTEAAKLTENTMHAAGNVLMATHNVKKLSLKSIAKKTAKETSNAVYDEMLKAKGTSV